MSRKISPESLDYRANLLADARYRKLVKELKELAPQVPRWKVAQPVSELESAYWTGMEDGFLQLVTILEGQT